MQSLKKRKIPWGIKKTTTNNPHHLCEAKFSQWSHLTIKGVPWLLSQLQCKLPHFMKSCPPPTAITAFCSLSLSFNRSFLGLQILQSVSLTARLDPFFLLSGQLHLWAKFKWSLYMDCHPHSTDAYLSSLYLSLQAHNSILAFLLDIYLQMFS